MLQINPYSILLMDNQHRESTTALRDFLVSSSEEIENYTVKNETLFHGGAPAT